MWGLQLSLVTGRLVAELISGLPVSHDLQPLAPGRFALSGVNKSGGVGVERPG
jgi:glycine/D-amino acid oxidase-like deaminating enzyme